MRRLSFRRRQASLHPDLVPADDAGGLAGNDPPHGLAQQSEHRARSGARDREVPVRPSRPRARRGQARRVRSRAPAHRFQVHGRRRDRARVLELSFDRPRDAAAPLRAGVEPADQHAPRLVPARRLPGVPSSGPGRHRAGRGRAAAGQPASVRKSRGPSEVRVPVDHAGVDRMVRDDAQPAARRARGRSRATRTDRGRSTDR